MTPSPRTIAADAAKALVHGDGEVAFLDVREAAAHGDGHPLFAAPCPYSRLETTAAVLVPRRSTPIVLLDDGDALAPRAARRLAAMGYTDVQVLAGGTKGWTKAGHRLFSGVNVPSKTLGELIEHAFRPARIDADTLKSWMDDRRAFRLFDVRPPEEYARMTVPGAESGPNGELAHRFAEATDQADTPVVLTCAGRTRGIVGAVGLALAGIKGPVFALEDGTQGWALAGHDLARGNRPKPLPPLTPAARSASRDRARRVREARRIPALTAAEVESLLGDPTRTTFCFDLRTADERNQEPLDWARPVPGVQLVQATDHHIGVLRSTVVLVDDTGLRASLAAAFLAMMGHRTMVFALDEQPSGSRPAVAAAPAWQPPPGARMTPAEAVARAAAGVPILDLRPSTDHALSRPAGATWTLRPRIVAAVPDGAAEVLLFAADPATADLAAMDLADAGIRAAFVAAGIADWRAAGGRLDDSPRPMDGADDVVWFTRNRHDGDRDASLRYLAWEKNLVADLDTAERAAFRVEA